MSLVVFPFKQEDMGAVAANLTTAARNERVDEVWAVSATEGEEMGDVSSVAVAIATRESTPIKVFAQETIGTFRSGKGDGMNTAIRRAAERGFDRVHFYDADITNFDDSWIEGAESAADRGYRVVRHRFPRASTDAMITWMITKPSLAMLFPGTVLPRLGQPLGGEMLLTGEAIAALASDSAVRDRSDWGVDTMITHATTTIGLPLYEHNVAEGKRHALYGSLDEIRTMAIECLDAVISLGGKINPDESTEFAAAPPEPVPGDLKNTVAYDVNPTVALLTAPWEVGEAALAEGLPPSLATEVLRNRETPHFQFMDAVTWGTTLSALHDGFRLGDSAWESLAFRLWLMRVLAYTTNQALTGYDSAIRYLDRTIHDYEKLADHHRET
jgi:mannosylglycerate synthase